MRIFIVHAHPEPQSFSGAMTRTAMQALNAAGHEVIVSDLYAMGFDPVSDRRNFTTVSNPDFFRQQAEEAYAAAHDGFAPDIQAEMDKLFWVPEARRLRRALCFEDRDVARHCESVNDDPPTLGLSFGGFESAEARSAQAEAIQSEMAALDCFAIARNDDVVRVERSEAHAYCDTDFQNVRRMSGA
jgi:Flavodoxin-like fold